MQTDCPAAGWWGHMGSGQTWGGGRTSVNGETLLLGGPKNHPLKSAPEVGHLFKWPSKRGALS